MDLDLKHVDGSPIADWRAWSPPKDLKHWRAGRSAVELARAWFTSEAPRIPPEFAALLASSQLLVGLRSLHGVPECVTALPEAGEGRNHDLVLEGETAGGRVLIAVEAKADEKFGQRIGKYWAQKLEERSAPGGAPSRAPERRVTPHVSLSREADPGASTSGRAAKASSGVTTAVRRFCARCSMGATFARWRSTGNAGSSGPRPSKVSSGAPTRRRPGTASRASPRR